MGRFYYHAFLVLLDGYSFGTSKQGQDLGANSLCPWMVAFGKRFFSDCIRLQSMFRCSRVLVSDGLPWASKPPM